ncbi:MAG: hypothetical protein PHU14_04200 [Methylovulum sp.]|nr:hypothetical protein [Methylovulum sp.]
MSAQLNIFTKSKEVEDQLSLLNTPIEILIETLKKGQAARNTATKYDPPNTAGNNAHSGTVRALREFLIPLGWIKNQIRNVSLTSNPQNSVSIVVYSGDINVGIDDNGATPSTRNRKGKQAQLYTQKNFDIFDTFYEYDIEKPEYETWVLLYYYDSKNAQIRAELSLPINMSNRGYIDGWSKRIILGPILLNKTTPPDFDNSQDFDIPIKRRKK